MDDDEQKLKRNGLMIGGPCKFCGGDSTTGMAFHGSNFKYLEDDEVAHGHCWIEYVVDKRIEVELNERSTDHG